ncbi:hypothetical protein [Maritalea porphyrae]|uniref:hypothetical protein n=1 Tax=Maritalea porphyrae TaxID=880732 RepID=UPI0022B0068E|nr:hypothetical protein [Maritalea porphyrae]MCZ4270942.1 hypothetical protein [Maritalea porphyrae]
MTEPTPTKEQIEAANGVYCDMVTECFPETDLTEVIAALLAQREQAARKEALKEAEKVATSHLLMLAHNEREKGWNRAAQSIGLKIKALIDKGE